MGDIELQTTVDIDRPHDQVWAVVADYERDPQWRAGVLTMAPEPRGPVTTSTRTAEQIRFAGRTWHNLGEVTSVDPGRRFTWRTTSGADASGSRTVSAIGDRRSRVVLTLRVRPRGAERLLRPVLARSFARTLRDDAQRLRVLAESAAADGDELAGRQTSPRA